MNPDIEKSFFAEWEGVKDPIGGGLKRVLEGLVVIQLNDGRYAVICLDGDSEPYFPMNDEFNYLDALARAEDMLRNWQTFYREVPGALEKVLAEKEAS